MGLMREMIEAAPRKTARELLAGIPAGPKYDDRVLLAVEMAINTAWWRGYFAAKDEQAAQASAGA